MFCRETEMEEKVNFEQYLLTLEDLIKKLEGANTSLDDSISCYEEAIRIVGVCNGYLCDAERKVKILTESLDGITESDFLKDGDEA